MVYTFQRRKAMNQAVRALYPNIEFYENNSGVPAMECYKLPEGARQITDAEDFIRRVKNHCSHTDGIGLPIPDYSKALPVFILSMELTGEGSRRTDYFYRVNYVSICEGSLNKAEEYIAAGKLYAVLTDDTCNP